MRRSILVGTGSALPERAVPNAELAKQVDTSDEWIVERTGITNRYIANEDETTSSLATGAAREAIAAAGIAADDIDLIVLATATPDQTFPATATLVQQNLGCNFPRPERGLEPLEDQPFMRGMLIDNHQAVTRLRHDVVLVDLRSRRAKRVLDGGKISRAVVRPRRGRGGFGDLRLGWFGKTGSEAIQGSRWRCRGLPASGRAP